MKPPEDPLPDELREAVERLAALYGRPVIDVRRALNQILVRTGSAIAKRRVLEQSCVDACAEALSIQRRWDAHRRYVLGITNGSESIRSFRDTSTIAEEPSGELKL